MGWVCRGTSSSSAVVSSGHNGRAGRFSSLELNDRDGDRGEKQRIFERSQHTFTV